MIKLSIFFDKQDVLRYDLRSLWYFEVLLKFQISGIHPPEPTPGNGGPAVPVNSDMNAEIGKNRIKITGSG